MCQALSQVLEKEEFAQRNQQSGSRFHSTCPIKQSRQKLNCKSERPMNIPSRGSSVQMIGCYDIQGQPAIHSWKPSYRPRIMYHQQGDKHHAKCLVLSLGTPLYYRWKERAGSRFSKKSRSTSRKQVFPYNLYDTSTNNRYAEMQYFFATRLDVMSLSYIREHRMWIGRREQ